MADKDMKASEGTEEGTSQDKPQVNQNVQPEPTVDLSKYVTIEQFREFQSKADRNAEERYRRGLEEGIERGREKTLAEIQNTPEYTELAKDLTFKARLEKLEAFEEQQKLKTQMDNYRVQTASFFGVDPEALVGIEDPQEIVRKARELEREKLLEELKGTNRQPKSDGSQEPPVSKAPGTSPSPERATMDEIDRKIKELRQTAREGGRGAEQARVEILKLEAQKQTIRGVSKARI